MSKKILSLLVLGSLLGISVAPGTALAAAPTITLVAPSQGRQGSSNLTVNITGSGFNSAKSVSFSGGGITVDSFATSSDTAMSVIIDIAKTASKTARDITITNAAGSTTKEDAFTVIAAAASTAGGVTGKMVECCKLKKDVEVKGVTYKEGIIVGKTISAGDCGATADVTTKCSESAGDTNSSDCLTDRWGTICLFNTIYGVTDLLFAILFALAILFFVYGGITMVMAAGDTEKFGKGKNYIMYALIGIVVALLAKAFPSIIKTVMGM